MFSIRENDIYACLPKRRFKMKKTKDEKYILCKQYCDCLNSVTKFYSQIADKKLMATVWPLTWWPETCALVEKIEHL